MRLLLFALLAYFLYRILRSYFRLGQKARKDKSIKREGGSVINEMVKDPVCRTYVPLREAKRRVVDGKEYFFCSDRCADEFEKRKV